MPKLELPPYGKHIVFLGATGSGKSVLAEQMLKRYESYLAIDTQDSLELGGKVVGSPMGVPWKLRYYKKIHYVPRPEFLEKDYFDYIFKKALESSTKKKPRPRIIYIDEIYHIGYGISFPQWLPKGITTARQRKLSFWTATQRPRLIPIPILTEASMIIVFFLSKDEDIKFVSGFARSDKKAFEKVLRDQADDYSFIIINPRKGTWQKYPKLKLN